MRFTPSGPHTAAPRAAHPPRPNRSLSKPSALLTWRAWNNSVPRCAYSEELCEAGFSRLGSACRFHPQLTSLSECTDLYLLSAPSDAPGCICDKGLTVSLCNVVTHHLASAFVAQTPVVTFVPWLSGAKVTAARATWSPDAWVPGTLWDRPQTNKVTRHFRRCLLLLVRACPTEDLVGA